MARNMILKLLIVFLLVFLLPIIIVLVNFRLIAFNEDFYHSEFKKLDVYDNYPDADNFSRSIIDYYTKGKELPPSFNEKEKMHLEDVKKAINSTVYFLYAIIAIYLMLLFLLSRMARKPEIFFAYVKKSLFAGSILLLTMLCLSIIIFTQFSFFFMKFHLMLFREGSFVFPADSPLIRVFPEQFFIDIVQGIIVNSMIFAIALASVFIITVKKK